MKIVIEKGDQLTLLPPLKLFQVFKERVFFSEAIREKLADDLGGERGIVDRVWDSHKVNKFYFKKEGDLNVYLIPHEAVDFSKGIIHES